MSYYAILPYLYYDERNLLQQKELKSKHFGRLFVVPARFLIIFHHLSLLVGEVPFEQVPRVQRLLHDDVLVAPQPLPQCGLEDEPRGCGLLALLGLPKMHLWWVARTG